MEYKEKIFKKYSSAHYIEVKGVSPKDYEHSSLVYSKTLRDFLPKDKETRFIDLGCGAGHFLYMLKQSGYENIFGIDVSEEQVELCRKIAPDKVTRDDVRTFLEQNKIKWHFISMLDVIEHFPKLEIYEILSSIYNSLEDNGKILIKTSNMANLFGNYTRYIDFTHECGFTDLSLRQVLLSIGFKNVRIIPRLKSVTIAGTIRDHVSSVMHKIIFRVLNGTKPPETFWREIIMIADR